MEIAIIRLLIFALILFVLIAGIVLAIYFLINRFVQKPTLSQDQRKREEREQQWSAEAKVRHYREPRNNAERYRDFISMAVDGFVIFVFIGLMAMTPLYVAEKTKELVTKPTKRDRHTFPFLALLFMVVCSISLGALSILLRWERWIFITAIAIFIAAWVGLCFMAVQTKHKAAIELDQQKRHEEHEKWLAEAKAKGYQEPRNDAELYRDFIRSMAWSPPDHRVPYESDEFYKWLEEAYEEASKDTKFSVFTAMIAIGLMTYGRLDMIDVALENMANSISVGGQVGRIPPMFFVKLLPLPEDLTNLVKIRANKEQLRAWLKENKSRLRWDDEQGKFVLMD